MKLDANLLGPLDSVAERSAQMHRWRRWARRPDLG